MGSNLFEDFAIPQNCKFVIEKRRVHFCCVDEHQIQLSLELAELEVTLLGYEVVPPAKVNVLAD